LNLFLILIIKLISSLLSIGHYRSFPSAVAILFMLVIQKCKKVHRVVNESKTNRWQCSCPIKRHENSILIYINYIRIILKYMVNICFLEMELFCCNSADGFHGISACEWHTVELLNRLNNLGMIHTSKTKLHNRREDFNFPIVNFPFIYMYVEPFKQHLHV
jgi:hypothetical protein